MGHLLIRPFGTRRERPANELGQDLVGRDVGLERTLEEPVESHRPLATRRAQDGRVVERQQQRWQVRRWIGVADRSADRSAIAHLDIADTFDAVPCEIELRIGQRLGICRQGADLPAAVGRRLVDPQLVELADVDELGRLREAKLHERQQAHPTGDDLGIAAGQRTECVVERRRALVVECRRDHAWPPFADWIADQTVWAV